jgi:hypothetical protein
MSETGVAGWLRGDGSRHDAVTLALIAADLTVWVAACAMLAGYGL